MSKQQQPPTEEEKSDTRPVNPPQEQLSLNNEELFLLYSLLTIDRVAIIPLLKASIRSVEEEMDAREMVGYAIKAKVKAALGRLQKKATSTSPPSP